MLQSEVLSKLIKETDLEVTLRNQKIYKGHQGHYIKVRVKCNDTGGLTYSLGSLDIETEEADYYYGFNPENHLPDYAYTKFEKNFRTMIAYKLKQLLMLNGLTYQDYFQIDASDNVGHVLGCLDTRFDLVDKPWLKDPAWLAL